MIDPPFSGCEWLVALKSWEKRRDATVDSSGS
jgi:hypothetical protein